MPPENAYQLTVTMPSDREVSMSRSFDAPRDLVFRAFIEPDLVQQWWGQRESRTVIDRLEAHAGGGWRFVHQMADGAGYAFRGEFLEVSPPDRVTWTFEFEGMPGQVLTETMTFTESDGLTTITSSSLFDTTEQRDGMLNSGMEAGAAESYDRLAELLKMLQ